MKKSASIVFAFGIIFLFFIQSAGTLVESIYILDLMNSTLDEKALGVLFFFTPVLLIPLYKKYPRPLVWLMVSLLLFTRITLPNVSTAGRVLVSGLCTFASLSLFFLLWRAKPAGEETHPRTGLWVSGGLALAISVSTLLRTWAHGIDYSLLPEGTGIGMILGMGLVTMLVRLDLEDKPKEPKTVEPVTASITGLFLVLTLAWFAFSAPAVIARWAEADYMAVVMTVSLLSTGWALVSLYRPHYLDRMTARVVLVWNVLFTLSLTGTILAHSVPFPPAPDSPAVTVGAPAWFQQVPLAFVLLLFPVIFLDMRIFLDQIQRAAPPPRRLVPGLLLGGLIVTLLVFANIFTNVWGYVDPVSPPFRGTYWLTFFLMAGTVSALTWRTKRAKPDSKKQSPDTPHWAWTALIGSLVLATALTFLPTAHAEPPAEDKNSLTVMTFNTQQSNDDFGEKSLENQLELIRKVSPDVLALQETDSTRISLNNNDYVRYFAEKLRYHSYYGPKTVTGTYGTAILSRYPLLDTRTVFTYSDQDEIGTAEAGIEVGGRRFTIYNVHPDGSDTAMLAFARDLLARSADDPYVIALGDFNLRDYDEAYQLIDAVYTNAWTSVFPTEIGANGTDMSGKDRIDHIFVSPALGVRDPRYILPPESATDHPVHWAEVYWE